MRHMRTGQRARGSGDFGRFLYRNRLLILLLALLLLGELIGAMLMRGTAAQTSGTLSFLTQGFIKARSEQTLLATFSSSFFGSALLIMLAFLFGFCAIAQPVILFIPLFRGLGLGISMAYLYGAYGLRGMLACLVLILPNAVLSALVILVACRESLRLSALFLSYAGGQRSNPTPLQNDGEMPGAGAKGTMQGAIKLYLLKFTLLLIAAVLAALIDAMFTFFFAGMFNF